MRKIITFFMTLTLIVNSSIIVFANNTQQELKYVQERYVENLDLVGSLGIFSNEIISHSSDEYVLCSEAYGYILDLMNVEYDASNIAESAMKYGLISSAEEFRINSKLSKNEMIALFVDLLGYKTFAQVKGGYPSGYLYTAKKLDLVDSFDMGDGHFATYYEFFNILVNSFETNTYELSGISERNQEINTVFTNDGDTLLSRNFNIDIVEGLLSENYRSSLLVPYNNDKGFLRIGEKSYYAADRRFADLLGHNVRLFVRDLNKVIYVQPINSVELFIDSLDFIEFDGTQVKYYEGEKLKKARLDTTDIYVLYNGVAFSNYSVKDLNSFDGEMILIDNDDDGKYEIVKVNDYVTGSIRSVNVFDKSVTFEFPKGVVYDLRNFDDNQIAVIIEDGGDVPFTYMLDRDVVSVLQSRDGNSIEFRVSRKTGEGMFEAVRDDTIEISGQVYGYTDEIKKELDKYVLGDTFKFALDIKGRIAHIIERTGSDLRYGYIISALEPDGLSSSCKIKLLDQSDEILILESADKVKLDGNKVSGKDLYKKLINSDTGAVSQIIKYRVANEKITTIDTKKESGYGAFDSLKTKEYTSLPYNMYRRYPEQVYNDNVTTLASFGGVAIAEEGKTPIFRVPKIIKEDPLFVFPDTYYSAWEVFNFRDESAIIERSGDYIEFVDYDDFMFSEAVVYYNNINKDSIVNLPIGGGQTGPVSMVSGNSPLVINRISRVLDNDEEIYRVYAISIPFGATDVREFFRESDNNQTNYVSFDIPKSKENLLWKAVYNADGSTVSGEHTMIEPGDIVQFTQKLKEISTSYVVYDTNLTFSQNANRLKTYTFGSPYGYTLGVPYEITTNFVKFCSEYDVTTGNVIVSEQNAMNLVLSGDCMDINLNYPEQTTYETLASAGRSYTTYGDDAGYMLIVSYNSRVRGVYCIHY